jgi:hypothetical protein
MEERRACPVFNAHDGPVEALQAKVDRLQEAVRILLMKNQTMRMALLARIRKEEETGSV